MSSVYTKKILKKEGKFCYSILNNIFGIFTIMDSEYEEELRAQLAQLQEEHRDLDEVISKLMTTPPVDFIQLQRLKKRKLSLKDENGEALQKTFSDGQKRLGGIGDYLCDKIAKVTGSETRVTVLGHTQRGAQPTYTDRMIASAFGVKAVDLIKEGKFGRMVAWQNREVVDVAISDAIATYQDVNVNGSLIHTARGLGICLGD
jgi:6-phosphofructokinase